MTIRSIRHRGLKRLVEQDESKGLAADKIDRIRKILAMLILADDLNGFIADAPPGWRVHRLEGKRRKVWSIAVSGNWRITFEIMDGAIEHLNFEDYH